MGAPRPTRRRPRSDGYVWSSVGGREDVGSRARPCVRSGAHTSRTAASALESNPDQPRQPPASDSGALRRRGRRTQYEDLLVRGRARAARFSTTTRWCVASPHDESSMPLDATMLRTPPPSAHPSGGEGRVLATTRRSEVDQRPSTGTSTTDQPTRAHVPGLATRYPSRSEISMSSPPRPHGASSTRSVANVPFPTPNGRSTNEPRIPSAHPPPSTPSGTPHSRTLPSVYGQGDAHASQRPSPTLPYPT
ncbi:hypothetical protein BC628DRAFT_1094903 [Trametes gibbosa]|nr:hypothetical protein BC628DRAFT_1094903 [Trametes gibbosa]